jgi:hypothetical protein
MKKLDSIINSFLEITIKSFNRKLSKSILLENNFNITVLINGNFILQHKEFPLRAEVCFYIQSQTISDIFIDSDKFIYNYTKQYIKQIPNFEYSKFFCAAKNKKNNITILFSNNIIEGRKIRFNKKLS